MTITQYLMACLEGMGYALLLFWCLLGICWELVTIWRERGDE